MFATSGGKGTLCLPPLGLHVARGRFVCHLLVYIVGGQRPPWVRITAECKLNLYLSGVLVYIAGGQPPPGVRITTECKPNLSLSGVWFTFLAGSARRGLEPRSNVNQILL